MMSRWIIFAVLLLLLGGVDLRSTADQGILLHFDPRAPPSPGPRTVQYTLEWIHPELPISEDRFCSQEFYPVDGEEGDSRKVHFYVQEGQEELLLEPLLHTGNWKLLEQRVGEPFAKIHADQILRGYSPELGLPDGYHNPAQLLQEFQELQQSHPDLVRLINLNQEYQTPLTVEGRSLYAVMISGDLRRNSGKDRIFADDTEKRNILVVTNHHSRELMTPEFARDLVLNAVEGWRSRDPDWTKLLRENQLYVVPTMNPDGLNTVWTTDNMWRKNRRKNVDGTFGVDLNRNYHVGWDLSCGGSSVPGSETFKGIEALSEAETQTMVAFQRERKFSKVLDLHSYAREVRTIYGDCAKLPPQLDKYFSNEAQLFAGLMTDYTGARSCCTGGNVHQAYHDHGSFTFLVETGKAFQPDFEGLQEEIRRIRPGVKAFLMRPIPVIGRIVSAADGKGLTAKITLDGLDYQLGEENWSAGHRNGMYHLWIPEGLWRGTVVAEGHETAKFTVTVLPNQTQELNIRLQKL